VQFDTIMKYVHCEMAAPAPNLIFQLVGNPRGTSEMRWQEVISGHKTLFAFHGSRLDNFHSILHYGLQQHLNKVSICLVIELKCLRQVDPSLSAKLPFICRV
jgi:Poly(ADP-ribose) polymerase catalytic domain.